MIALLGGENQAAFASACESDPIIGAQLLTDHAIFNVHSRDADFWVATDSAGAPTAALSLIGGRLMIAGGESADGELVDFVASVGGWAQLRANASLCRQLNRGGDILTAPAMIYTGPAFGLDYALLTEPTMAQVYPLLRAQVPGVEQGAGWDRWYAMTSHLFRHNLGYALGVYEGSQLVSTAGVYAFGQTVGVIACVATLAAYRGRGYAGLLVRCLCDRLLAMGKTPALQCSDHSLSRYYGAMGFVEQGRWGKITIGGYL